MDKDLQPILDKVIEVFKQNDKVSTENALIFIEHWLDKYDEDARCNANTDVDSDYDQENRNPNLHSREENKEYADFSLKQNKQQGKIGFCIFYFGFLL